MLSDLARYAANFHQQDMGFPSVQAVQEKLRPQWTKTGSTTENP